MVTTVTLEIRVSKLIDSFHCGNRLLLEEKLSAKLTDEVCSTVRDDAKSTARWYCTNTSSVSPLASHLLLKEKAVLFHQGEHFFFLAQDIVDHFNVLLGEFGIVEALQAAVGEVDLIHAAAAQGENGVNFFHHVDVVQAV